MKVPAMRRAVSILYLTVLALLCGCSDDDDEPESPGAIDAGQTLLDAGFAQGEGGSTSLDDAGPGATLGPLRYALVTQVFGASDQTSYLRLHEGSLFGGSLATSGGIERAGRALVVAGVTPGSVYYAGDKLPKVDRYDVRNAQLASGESVSFAGVGVAGISEYAGQFVMLSPTKALYFDSRTLKVLVWNPETMTLTKSIDVSALSLASYTPTFSTVTARRGNKVFMPVGYRTPSAVPSVTAVVVIDTESDTAKIVKDERCGYVRDAVEADDGMWYLATEAFASALHYLNTAAAPAPCLLRFDFAQERYDPGFAIDLNALAAGRTVGSLVKLPNGKVYTRVLDETKLGQLEMPSGRGVASAVAWGWAELTLGNAPTLTDVPGAYLMGGSLIPLPLGDQLVIPAFSGDLAKTTLCDMSSGPTCDVRAEVPGLVFSIARLH